MPPPSPQLSLWYRVKYGGWDRERGLGGGPFLSLRIAYIPNPGLLQSLVGVGGGVASESNVLLWSKA